MTLTRTLLAGLLALGPSGQVIAQEETPAPTKGGVTEATKPDKAARDGAKPVERDWRFATATLRVQLVISRSQNDKKLASLPYAFLVGARPPGPGGVNRVRMRMGVDTPVTVVSVVEGKQKSETQYRNVGTNIDCWATDQGNGTYQLNLSVENSSAIMGAQNAQAKDEISSAPLFRRFETFIDPVLRDGQTIQTVASTDPVTGEVVKIDVTMNVVK